MLSLKRFISVAAAVIFLLPLLTFNAFAMDLSAESAVLMEAESNTIIFSKNPDEKLPMASTTKIMTSIIALENADLYKEVAVTKEMVTVEGTSMGLLPGDKVSVYELVCGMLLSSGNDAANSVAYVMSGGIPEFSSLMNEYAQKIGMTNSSFVTPSGLDAKGHYSTAKDMALLGSYAVKNREFLDICSSEKVRIDYGNPPYLRTLSNHNKLLSKYENCVGIKTGFTKKSGRCLVSAAQKDGVTLVAVTLKAPDDWNDHIKMFEYGFSVAARKTVDNGFDYEMPVVGGKQKSVELRLAYEPKITTTEMYNPDVVRKVYINKFEYAPIKSGRIVGEAVYIDESTGKELLSVPIITAKSVEAAG